MTAVRISTLGPTALCDAQGQPLGITRDAQLRLVSILACADGNVLTTEVLIDRFWTGAPPDSAKGALHTHISALRRRLPPDTIVTEGHGYVLARDRVEVDAWELVTLAAVVAEQHAARSWGVVADLAQQAWSFPAGEPFADLADDEFARSARARITAARSTIDDAGIHALIESGRHDLALVRAEAVTAEHPLRERAWELLARARSGLGRHGEAMRAIHDARQALAEAGLEAGPGLRAIEQQLIAAAEATASAHTVLPVAVAEFVGRDAELKEVHRLLAEQRLVSLVAEGGTGKSRLALEFAHEIAAADATVWFVELAAERNLSIAARVAATIGVHLQNRPSGALMAVLRREPSVLVLDNCEHRLADVAAFVTEVLSACPLTRVLATSRWPLGVPGEFVHRLVPLATPPADRPTEPSDATALFVERARLAKPGFEPSDDDLVVIGRICRSLGGLPLAIELAAGQLWHTTIDDLSRTELPLTNEHIGDEVEHWAVIHTAVERSLSRLAPVDAHALRCLATLRAHFDSRVADAVTGLDHDQVQRSLGRLVDAAFLTLFDEAPPRYRMLEPVRDVLSERLDPKLQAEVAARHVAHFADRCRELRLWWVQPPERRAQPTSNRWWTGLPFGIEDITAAASAAGTATGDHTDAADTLGVLAHIAAAEGRHHDAVEYLEALLVNLPPGDIELEALSRSLLATELVLIDMADSSVHHMDLALAEARTMAPGFAKVMVLSRAALHTLSLPGAQPAAGVAPAMEALEHGSTLGPAVVARLEVLVATMLARAGRSGEARPYLDRAIKRTDASDPAVEALVVTGALNVAFFGSDDAGSLEQWVDRALECMHRHPSAATGDLGTWAFWVLLQVGRYDEAESVLRLIQPVEGYELAASSALRARLLWCRGDANGAADCAASALRQLDDHYWESHLRATAAEASAEIGDLTAVRRHVERLALSRRSPANAATMAGVLRPLVQAEIDAAIRNSGDARARHTQAAAHALERLRDWSTDSTADGAIAFESVSTYLALADAEMTRLATPSEQLASWGAAAQRVRTAKFAEYVARRLADIVPASPRTTNSSLESFRVSAPSVTPRPR